MKKGCWEDKEVRDLFSAVEDMKDSNRPLKSAFIAHAEKYRRKPNSVRNYYYFQLVELQKDQGKTKRLGIDLSRHEKTDIEYFSKQEQDKLIEDIDRLVKGGLSIRKACYQLSGGDLNLMLRYQNKYRNYVLKNSKEKTMPSNIITFSNKKKHVLSESDINSLFIGLVRLVKRNAIEEYSSKVKNDTESANASLRKVLVDLNKKDKEIEKLKAEFSKLKSENLRLVQKMMKLQLEKAGALSQNKL